MTTKISGVQIQPFTIETTQLSNTAVAAFAVALAPKVLYANVANSAFTVLDDTAVNVGGGYIVVTGSEFQSGATVLIDTTPASAVTFVNSTTLRVQVPTKAAASYNLYVVNPDGGVGVKVSGITYSSEPTWVTSSPLSNQTANTAFGVNLSATGAASYSVAAGSTLPAGTTLAANGYFSGTVSIGAETTYTFSVVATDAELQDASKTFQVTVTVTPPKKMYSWGNNQFFQLGLNGGSSDYKSSPTQIGSGTTWDKIAAAQYSGLAIKTDGTLWTWGFNNIGQLGLSDTIFRSSPVQIGTNTNWSAIAAASGSNSFSAIKTDGTLWSWGQNNYGQLGLNDITYRSSPVQVGSGTTWLNIDVGSYVCVAIKTDATLWAWGFNPIGLLGNSNTITRSSPVQVGFDNTWSKVAIGQNTILATKTNGTLWSWGNNYFGSLGLNQGQSIPRSSPTQVGADTTWQNLTVGNHLSVATKTNGTLWSWGRNDLGQLGQNNTTYRSSPVQVGSGTTWLNIAVGEYTTLATKTDGTLWSWGWNNSGQLGNNTAGVHRSSPTQVGGSTNWSKIANGFNWSLATTEG